MGQLGEIKVIFYVNRRVEYGQTIGVMGSLNFLGCWSHQGILPLKWTEGDIWEGQITISIHTQSYFECKFVIFNQEPLSKTNNIVEVEKGANRIYNLHNSIQFPKELPNHNDSFEISEIFNLRKITFAVYAPQGSSLYVCGKISQLRIPQKLSQKSHFQRIKPQNIGLLPSKKTNKPTEKHQTFEKEIISLFSGDFYINMCEDIVRYHYVKNLVQIERGVNRYLLLNSQVNNPLSILYSMYSVETFKEELSYDQISENLFVGPLINCDQDVKTLQEKGVTAILSLQTPKDMERKLVNLKEIRHLCNISGIVYVNVPIKDKDVGSFIQRAPKALNILKDLFNDGHTIYLHCTAGIGRAPQTALLHLILHRKMSFQDASQTIFLKRPISSPNIQAVFAVMEIMQVKSDTDDKEDDSSSDSEEDIKSTFTKGIDYPSIKITQRY